MGLYASGNNTSSQGWQGWHDLIILQLHLATHFFYTYCHTFKELVATASMADELDELNPSDVVFLEKLKESKNTAIFKVAVNGTICVMKVVRELN